MSIGRFLFTVPLCLCQSSIRHQRASTLSPQTDEYLTADVTQAKAAQRNKGKGKRKDIMRGKVGCDVMEVPGQHFCLEGRR